MVSAKLMTQPAHGPEQPPRVYRPRRTVALGFAVSLLLISWWGCGQNPGSLPPSRGLCLQDGDCSQGSQCRRGVCVQGSTTKTTDANGEAPAEPGLREPGSGDPGSPDQPSSDNEPSEPSTEPGPENTTPELIPEGGACVPGASQSCYRGAAGTLGVGKCKAGTQTCQTDGLWGPCEGDVSPRPELCNGEDDDCDGDIDEDYTLLGKSCESTNPGACKAQGTYICADDNVNVVCDAVTATPKPEECNGVDDDCDGKIDNVQGKQEPITRSCYSGPQGTENVGTCKAGTSACQNGKWQACSGDTKPTSETCNKLDDDCNGQVDDDCCSAPPCCSQGDTQDCGDDTGECQKGQQTCGSNNQWGACVGATNATKERCDGKDNDCDGKTDEDFNVGQPCPVGQGECQRQGQLKCKDASTTECIGQPGQPSSEKCDGKDNDCDGRIDERNPEGGGQCDTGLKGECKAGTKTCKSGKLECVQTHQKAAETCRNNKDDDCDGQIDEICGTQYPHALITHFYDSNKKQTVAAFMKRAVDNSTIAYQFKAPQRRSTGIYHLTPSNSADGCGKRPLILTPYSHYKRALAYSCSGDSYLVHTTNAIESSPSLTTISRGDGVFFAVIPNQNHDHWAMVDHTKCNIAITAGLLSCVATTNHITNVVRTGTGVYQFKSDRCKDANNPIFATIQGSQPGGWAGVKNLGNGTCEVRTFSANQSLNSFLSFAVWLPDPKKEAWAKITPNGTNATINASNTFNEPGAQWVAGSITYNQSTCPPNNSSTCLRTSVAFQASRNPSVILLQGLLTGSNVLQTHSAVRSSSNVTNGPMRDISISGFIGSSVTPQEAPFYILYIQ